MKSVRFYGRRLNTLETMLPKLIERVHGQGIRTVIVFDTIERLEVSDQTLWTYTPLSFLPHGSAKDGDPSLQPIYLTTTLENPNNATLLVLTTPLAAHTTDLFDEHVYIYDATDPRDSDAAKKQFGQYQQAGYKTAVFMQDAKGGWTSQSALE